MPDEQPPRGFISIAANWLADQVILGIRLYRRSMLFLQKGKPPVPSKVVPRDEMPVLKPAQAGRSAAKLPQGDEREEEEAPPMPLRQKKIPVGMTFSRPPASMEILEKPPRSSLVNFLLRLRIVRLARVALRQVVVFHTRKPPEKVAKLYLCVLGAVALLTCIVLLLQPGGPIVSKTAKILPPSPKILLQEAISLMNDEKYDEAMKKVAEAKAVSQNEFQAYQIEGSIFAVKKDFTAARQSFQKAFNLRPNSPSVRFNLAELEFSTGNYAEAESTYRALARVMPENKILPFRLYLCCLMQQRHGDALEIAAGTRPQSLEWFYIQAVESFKAGKKGEARKLLRTARILYEKDTKPYDQTLNRLKLAP